MRFWFKVLRTAAKNWSDDNAFKHSAAVSFYTLFSMAPITVIAVGIVGFFLGEQEANRQFLNQVTLLVGKASADTIEQAVKASTTEEGNWISTVVGLGLLLVGATTVFGQMQDSLNSIWHVKSKPSRSGWVVVLFQRLISFAMVVTIGFLLLVSLVVTTLLTNFTGRLDGAWAPTMARVVDFGIALGVITVLFACIFKILPDVKLRWRDVWGSALLTALLFSGGRFLIAFYLGHSTVASVYGAAGSLVALLIWVYYSCAILFFGVEFTRSYHEARGLKIVPKDTAVAVREEIVEGKRGKALKTVEKVIHQA